MKLTMAHLFLSKSFEDLPDIPGFLDLVTLVVIEFLEAFLEVDMSGTIDDVLHDWLDVDLAVSEECLHLAVNTPVDLTQGEGKHI